jgi:hypothetical protein
MLGEGGEKIASVARQKLSGTMARHRAMLVMRQHVPQGFRYGLLFHLIGSS